MAGGSLAEGLPRFATSLSALWSGDVEAVIAALESRQTVLGEPQESDSETHPWTKLAEALGYFRNQKDRMRYAEYRRSSVPITSSHVESTIKQINRRVKGTEKFWSEPGSEAILQLRADLLSETEPLMKFWTRRAEQATGERRQAKRNAEKMGLVHPRVAIPPLSAIANEMVQIACFSQSASRQTPTHGSDQAWFSFSTRPRVAPGPPTFSARSNAGT